MAFEVNSRKCNECGETWVDTGTDECPYCGSEDTDWADDGEAAEGQGEGDADMA